MKGTKAASSTSPAVDILNHNEGNKHFSESDREFIVDKGFYEWLLAMVKYHTVKTAGADVTVARLGSASIQNSTQINSKYGNVRIQSLDRSELVILVANLIGGTANDPN